MAHINNNSINFALLKGDSVYIRYSAFADGTDFTEQWSEGKDYIGIATGQTAPTDKNGYQWICLGSPNLSGYVTTEQFEAALGEYITDIDTLVGGDS